MSHTLLFFQIFLTLVVKNESKTDTSCFLDIYNWMNHLPNNTKAKIATIVDLTPPKVSPEDVSFLFYPSSSNNSIPLQPSTLNLLNPSIPTKIIIHGWDSSGTLPWVQEMALRYHRKEKCNVVAVDWSKHAQSDYVYAAAATEPVGRLLGDFILRAKLVLRNLHLIGHSLGGHIAGFAGKRVKSVSIAKIRRISGLDVAAPFFEIPVLTNSKCRLTKYDAGFVDLIHTQIGIRGLVEALGHVDFYVNGGLVQLVCPYNYSMGETVSCGHGSAHLYFSRTILEPEVYRALACDSFVNFIKRLCDRNRQALMGDGASRRVSGRFYIFVDENGNPVQLNAGHIVE